MTTPAIDHATPPGGAATLPPDDGGDDVSKDGKPGRVTVAYYLPPDLLARIDVWRERHEAAHRIPVNKSAAVAALLAMALDAEGIGAAVAGASPGGDE